MTGELLCGLDEVGRGAIAGPLIAAAVILPKDFKEKLASDSKYLKDSKQLSPEKRQEIATYVFRYALALELFVVEPHIIDEIGITKANVLAFESLIERVEAHKYVVDGNLKVGKGRSFERAVECVVDGDASIPAVSAAAIVAKVYRDRIMKNMAIRYPGYGFEHNFGYATLQHINALTQYGPTEIHRKTFLGFLSRNQTNLPL